MALVVIETQGLPKAMGLPQVLKAQNSNLFD